VEVIFSPSAIDDLAQIRAYIGKFNPSAAVRMAARLIEAGNSLHELPERGRKISRGRRELPVAPPYVVRYRIKGELVEILGIRHGRQRPLP
jgi:addiction module RelE/StbE family toxin